MEFLYLIRVAPKTRTDQAKLGGALAELAGKDPTFLCETDSGSGQAVIYGTGEQQLEDVVERLANEHGVELHASKPQIAYRETIRKSAEAEGRYMRQVGGSGNYAHVRIRIEPNEPGKGFKFTEQINGGVIPSQYFEPIKQGISDAMRGGVLEGYEIIDVRVTLFDGSFHEVDSNEMAFTIAGAMAFKEAARKAAPVVLEPIIAVKVTVPEQYAGRIIRDFSSRGGKIEGIVEHAGSQVIQANVPLREMAGYPDFVAAATSFTATWSMRLKCYQPRRGNGGSGPGAGAGVLVPKSPRSNNPPAQKQGHGNTET